MDSDKVSIEIQIDNIIQQLRFLSDEAIAILHEDGFLSSKYIDELAFRVQECLIRKSRTLKKMLHHETFNKLRHPVKRPQKLDLSLISQYLAPKRTKINHPHTPE